METFGAQVMTPNFCWDCPATFLESFAVVFVSIALFAGGAAARTSPRRLIRFGGSLILSLAVFLLCVVSYTSRRNGVALNDHFERRSGIATLFFVVVPVVFAAGGGVWLVRHSHGTSDSEQQGGTE